jgi:hypothetical protein
MLNQHLIIRQGLSDDSCGREHAPMGTRGCSLNLRFAFCSKDSGPRGAGWGLIMKGIGVGSVDMSASSQSFCLSSYCDVLKSRTLLDDEVGNMLSRLVNAHRRLFLGKP